MGGGAHSGIEGSDLRHQRPRAQRRITQAWAGAFGSRGVRPSPAAPLSLQLTASEEEFLRTYAGVVSSQLSQLPQHSIDQGELRARAPATPSWGPLVVVPLAE